MLEISYISNVFVGFCMPFENGPNFAKLYEIFLAIFLFKSIQNSRYFEKFCDFLYQFFNNSSQTTYSTHSSPPPPYPALHNRISFGHLPANWGSNPISIICCTLFNTAGGLTVVKYKMSQNMHLYMYSRRRKINILILSS